MEWRFGQCFRNDHDHLQRVLLQQFTYQDDWYPETHGGGRSLQIVDAGDTDLGHWNLAANWRPSGTIGGAPDSAELSGRCQPRRPVRFDDFVQVSKPVNTKTTSPNSTWDEGDWNGDGDFDSSDFVIAFQTGLYQSSPRSPETHWLPPWIGCLPRTSALRVRVCTWRDRYCHQAYDWDETQRSRLDPSGDAR